MPDIQNYTELKGFRYERKYLADSHNSFQAEQVIRVNPLSFSEIFHERFINNVYFDTPRLDFYYDNAVGRFDRTKYRIRWYGDLYNNIEQPILELKIKRGTVGTKRSFKLNPFVFDRNFKLSNFKEVFASSNLPEDVFMIVKNLEPSIINRYSRKYFRSFSRDYRVTIDKEVSYFPVFRQNYLNRTNFKDYNSIIVELKYDDVLNENASKISNELPFRLSKNSKYVNGIQQFYEVLD